MKKNREHEYTVFLLFDYYFREYVALVSLVCLCHLVYYLLYLCFVSYEQRLAMLVQNFTSINLILREIECHND